MYRDADPRVFSLALQRGSRSCHAMRITTAALYLGCLSLVLSGCSSTGPTKNPTAKRKNAADMMERAQMLAQSYLIVDGHVDLPYRLVMGKDPEGRITEDVSTRTKKGDFDYVRAKEGGLDAPFMSIYIPAKHQTEGGAKALADSLIDLVESIANQHPDKFALARTPAHVQTNKQAGKISLPMGIENGAAIEGDLANLTHFHQRGIRYITLTHSKDNRICDSSYDEARTHKGLSELGKQVVAEMNRLGIMIDVSHISDDAFWQVMKLTDVPVIASHSSLRHFVPGFHRNMSDDMVKAMKKNGGVIMINFGSTFIDADANKESDRRREAAKKYAMENGLDNNKSEDFAKIMKFMISMGPMQLANVSQVADHIERVVQLAGIDHVGLGSDFDGVGPTMPNDLKDASQIPVLIAELLARGFSESDVEKLCSGNIMRVWQTVEERAAK